MRQTVRRYRLIHHSKLGTKAPTHSRGYFDHVGWRRNATQYGQNTVEISGSTWETAVHDDKNWKEMNESD